MDRAVFASHCAPRGSLPYADPSSLCIRIIVAALRHAWAQLLGKGAAAARSYDEDQTTTRLEAELLSVLDDGSVPGFGVPYFRVTRDAKVINFNGQHPDKMPDLAFHLYEDQPARPPDFGLHVECKPVNKAVGMTLYLEEKGMERFVQGDYGCKMRCGLMVAYADPGYTLATKITPRLKKHFGTPNDPLATVRLPQDNPAYQGSPTEPAVPESIHRRSWSYSDGTAPGDIALIHVWLQHLISGVGPVGAADGKEEVG